MYFVHYKNGFVGYGLSKFETMGEAKEFIKGLAEKGNNEFYLSQEIPMKIKVEVEI